MFSAFILPLYIVITKVIFFNIPTSLYKYLKVEGIQINGKIKTTPLVKRSGQIIDKRHPWVPFVILTFKCLALLMIILKNLLIKGENRLAFRGRSASQATA